MNRQAAEAKIRSVFKSYKAHPQLPSATKGKIYELFCLAKTLEALRAESVRIDYIGTSVAKFKAAPGIIKSSDPHFELRLNRVRLELFVNIEFRSLSTVIGPVNDRSDRHELDLVIVSDGVRGRPEHDKIVLGVECKAVGKFDKSILKEVLGIRRELSLLQQGDSKLHRFLGRQISIPANPGSSYWVCYVDKVNGDQYADGAAQFGIDFKALIP